MSAPSPLPKGLLALRDFARAQPPAERCELCGAALAEAHPHLFDPGPRTLRCTCPPCDLVFREGPQTPWRRVPRRFERLAGFDLGQGLWESLNLPIELAYLVRGDDGLARASFPSPAGVTTAPLSPETWSALAARNPALHDFAPEVEALLVHGIGGPRTAYRASVDHCFRLVGILRARWRGLSGGAEVWTAVQRFFDEAGGGRHA